MHDSQPPGPDELLSPRHDSDRDELHYRRIEMRGFQRRDGFFEVEGRVVDTKPRDFQPLPDERRFPAHEPIHNMGVRMVFDDALVVRAIETFTEASPFAVCPEGGRALQAMVGVSMTRGWSKEVSARLGGGRSCTHLKELLVPMATTAFQALSAVRTGRAEPLDAAGRPTKIDSCYAYRAEGALVLKRWPRFHRASGPE